MTTEPIRYQLVIQFPDSYFTSLEDVHAFEDRLIACMPKNVFTIFTGPRKRLAGMGCKARCAVDSSAINKRRNAADRPARHLPEGLGRNRAIGRPGCLHGHEPMRRTRSILSSRLRPNAASQRS